jgi:hypothetical protein
MTDLYKLAFAPQPRPVHNGGIAVHDAVLAKLAHRKSRAYAVIEARKHLGVYRYGALLRTQNGRDFLADLVQELGDASVYAMGAVLEYQDDEITAIYNDTIALLERVTKYIESRDNHDT